MVDMAEREGFEPSIRCYSYNGLANRRLQPLGHHSIQDIVTTMMHGVCQDGADDERAKTSSGYLPGVIYRALTLVVNNHIRR